MEQKLMKVCTGCGEEKEASAKYFKKEKRNKDGLAGKCKKCNAKYTQKYNKQNREKVLEKGRIRRQENKEEINSKLRTWRKNNKDTVAEQQRNNYGKHKNKILEYHKKYNILNKEKNKLYREENGVKIREYKKQYREENKEQEAERNRKWTQNNPEKSKIRFQRRRSKKRELPSTLTIQQWQEIKIKFNNICAYCGMEKPLTQEHFIPLSKGGEYTHNNIIPICSSCNSSKKDRDFFKWYPQQDYYSKEREQFILNHLGYKEDKQQLRII